MFAIIFTAIMATGVAYVTLRNEAWARVQNPTGGLWRHRNKFRILAVLFLVLQGAGMTVGRQPGWTQSSAVLVLQWVQYGALGVFAFLFFGTLILDLGSRIIFRVAVPSASRRHFLTGQLPAAVGTAALGFSSVGAYQALSTPSVQEIEIPLPSLPSALRGLRIAQLSDVHIGPTLRRSWLESVVDATLASKPDLIVLTGDLVDGLVEELAPECEPLRRLTAPLGVYYVSGNHEYFWGGEKWFDHFRSMGMQVLENEHVVIRRSPQDSVAHTLILGGVREYSVGRFRPGQKSDIQAAFAGAPAEAVTRVLLSHQPRDHDVAVQNGVKLQLAGHTHAGQFYPWALFLPLVYPYWKGLNRHRDQLWVYVHPGTGFWGPPVRFGVPPSITVLKLKEEVKALNV